jgi:dTDP-4-amino-4,6-dideoxygalactose transaminase
MAKKSLPQKLALFGGPKTVVQPQPPYPVIGHEEVNAATEVIMSRQLSDVGTGKFIQRFEKDFARYFGSKHCLSLSSGTSAIHCALFAVGVRPGAEVLTCAHNWISAITAILHAGGTPVFCDVKPGCWHIDPAEIKRRATPNTKAVVVTHLWGMPADMDPILKVCGELGIAVIEDVSHAQGSKYKGKYCGTIGDIGAFSLQGSKAIVAGEGGFLLTNSKRNFQRAQVPGHHGARLSSEMSIKEMKPFAQGGGAWTYRMFPVAAAIAMEQLGRLPALNAARQANFDRLRACLKNVSLIQWPKLHRDSVRGWYGTPANFDASKAPFSRETFIKACNAEGAGIGGEGYCDYSQIPLFQDMDLYSQMFVPKHANGVEFKPVKLGDLPNYDAIKKSSLRFIIPATESPTLMDQMANSIHKVLANADTLVKWEKAQGKAR